MKGERTVEGDRKRKHGEGRNREIVKRGGEISLMYFFYILSKFEKMDH